MSETTTTLMTVKQFCERNPWASNGSIRRAIFHGDTNGLDECIVRFGRRILLDEAKVNEWMRSGRATSLAPTIDKGPRRSPSRAPRVDVSAAALTPSWPDPDCETAGLNWLAALRAARPATINADDRLGDVQRLASAFPGAFPAAVTAVLDGLPDALREPGFDPWQQLRVRCERAARGTR